MSNKVEQGGMEQVIENEQGEKVDIMAPKTCSAWIDLYNGLAGKDVYQKNYYSREEGFEEKPLSFDEFQEMMSGGEAEKKTLFTGNPVLLMKVDFLIRDLGGKKVTERDREARRQFEKAYGKKVELNVLKPRSGDEWMSLYNVLAGRKLFKELNYGKNRDARNGMPISFEEFQDFVTETVSYKNQEDLDLIGEIDNLLKKISKIK